MQLNKETVSSPRLTKERPKSATRFPKSQSTYVVAFALRETYDDLVTAQQMICNKRSPQESINSITPTNSLKIFESNQTVKLFHILDNPDDKIDDNIIKNADVNLSEDNEINIEDKIQKETVDSDRTKNETSCPFQTNLDNQDDFNEPEIIFNATNFGQKHRENKFVRKCKAHKNAKPRCIFKCKAPKNTISNRLEKYYEKAKNNSVNSGNIQERISNITTVVSRTTVLKKGLAKENLLDENELTSISNELNVIENNEELLLLDTSTNNNQSSISHLNESTLIKKSSMISLKNDGSDNTLDSSNKMSSKYTTAYKTDVINVAVAVAYKNDKISPIKESSIANKEKFTHLEKLTSTETINKDMNELTSTIPSYFLELKPVEPDDSGVLSSNTSVKDKSNFETSSDDVFDMARTSSELNQPSDTSTSTLKNGTNKTDTTKTNEVEDSYKTNENKHTLLQTVIDLGYYPETTPSSSSAVSLHDVIVTEHDNKSYSVVTKNMEDNRSQIAEEKLFKKTFDNRKVSPNIKNINLPNQAQIKAMIDGYDTAQQRKCAEEVKHYPENIPEMWDRLTLFFDVAFKKLEESVTDKIVKELKASVVHNPQVHIPHAKDIEKGDVIEIEPPVCNKQISAQRIKRETDECVQCDLVQNKVIDQIMMKLVSQGPKIVEQGFSERSMHKLKKPKLLKDYFEVFKAPATVDPLVVVDKADTVTLTTISEAEVSYYRRFKMLILGPLRFVRENVLVISSVPGFLMVLLIMYGFLMLIIKSL